MRYRQFSFLKAVDKNKATVTQVKIINNERTGIKSENHPQYISVIDKDERKESQHTMLEDKDKHCSSISRNMRQSASNFILPDDDAFFCIFFGVRVVT